MTVMFILLCVLFVFFAKPLNAAALDISNIPNGDYSGPKRAGFSEPLVLIAHAAGSIDGYAGSNSLEALRQSAALGHRYIEVDMIPTSDGHIVLNHSWEFVSNRIPGVENGIMSYEEFMGHRIFNRFTPLDLDMLIEFLGENPDIRIITDTKDTDYKALYDIAKRFPEYRHRFIAQVYHFDSVSRIRALGFDDIMIGVYMLPYEMKQQPSEISRLALLHGVFAVSVPEVLLTQEYLSQLDTRRMRFISHNVECIKRARELREKGFYGIYSAFLTYSEGLPIPRLRSLPIPSYKRRIAANLSALGNYRSDLIAGAIFYQIDTPVYVHKGDIEAVRADAVAAPFISPLNGMVYLPARHFFRYTKSHDWQAGKRTLYIETVGNTFVLKGAKHELFLYRDMIFLSEAVIETIFSYRTLRKDSYIALIPYKDEHKAEILLETAKQIFQTLKRIKTKTLGAPPPQGRSLPG